MRKIIGAVFQSLDGVMQAPGGPSEDPSGGFELGGWTTSFWDAKTGAAMAAQFDRPFDLLLGRKTYDIFAAYWPFVPENHPIGAAFSKAAKYVITHSEKPLVWQNSHRITDIEGIKMLKVSEGPDLLIQGSSTLYPQLLEANLIDQLFVMTLPVILGKGKRLFGENTPPGAMKLISSDVSSSGVIIATYEPAGKVQVGTIQIENSTSEELKRREHRQRDGGANL